MGCKSTGGSVVDAKRWRVLQIGVDVHSDAASLQDVPSRCVHRHDGLGVLTQHTINPPERGEVQVPPEWSNKQGACTLHSTGRFAARL
jgi:hypothetical protein